ncbi:MAG: hypothetical protein US42_C0009G0036 [Candidatus Magasanikbacteria bacterium GW2011_GWC2_37_14]|uniref:Uncharacterized protein n=1 Tax=Candidatus Magasanikbacteria bacterium GW2011_GWC2_37_14 TaxID=1619046 RepID=A0A0G0JH58_9BACT|nr:MAG: hypothetical protein US42_C0009G0036 [Candidatus Magasanikbacteria bacterium GW2011_GWC2_37_14]
MTNNFPPLPTEIPGFNPTENKTNNLPQTPETTSVESLAPEKQPENPEQKPIIQEQENNFLEEAIGGLKQRLKTSKKTKQIPQVKDPITIDIEKIMEQELTDAYKELTPAQQQAFKIKGEETAWEIRALLKQTHVQIKKVFRLLLEWLKMLPGINRFFLEQEAKIKTDKIISLKEKHK